MKAILGIDPGRSGGFALRWPDRVLVDLMPLKADGSLDVLGVERFLRGHKADIEFAVVEEVFIRPGQRAQFAFAEESGMLKACLTLMEIPWRAVKPQVWQAIFPHGVEEPDRAKRKRLIKQALKEIASRHFPAVDLRESELSRGPHSGMSDALLISEYGHRFLRIA